MEGRARQHNASVQITFHGIPPSEAVEADVRGWIAKLAEVSDRIVGCRVAIELPHRHRQQGRLFRVRVDLSLPGKHVVIGRAPGENHAHEDVFVAIRDAFQAARRRLEDHTRRMRGQVKSRTLPPHGRIAEIRPGAQSGWIGTHDGRQIYFHRNSVLGGIGRLRVGDEVRFHEELGVEGPQASSVEPVGAHGHHHHAM
jgi:cold shock CspA family protein/ribosome-associated translation inhibitor RaiA